MNTNYIDVFGLDNVMLVYYYERLKEKLESMVYYLNQSINALNGVDGDLVRNFSIDETRINNVNIESVRENLKDRVSYLKYTIIPSIDSKISSLK